MTICHLLMCLRRVLSPTFHNLLPHRGIALLFCPVGIIYKMACMEINIMTLEEEKDQVSLCCLPFISKLLCFWERFQQVQEMPDCISWVLSNFRLFSFLLPFIWNYMRSFCVCSTWTEPYGCIMGVLTKGQHFLPTPLRPKSNGC